MKAKCFFKPCNYIPVMKLIAVLFTAAQIIFITGCKYSVSEPLWDQPYTAPAAPKITQVSPSEAVGGVNTITITGQNLIIGSGGVWVYFNNTSAEVISSSSTEIVARRPNLSSDSCAIKIIPHDAIQEAIYKPYKVTPVVATYGGFLQNVGLSAVAVDQNENLYVVETISKDVHKVTPDGTNTVISKTSFSPFDAKIGPDGNLYLTEKNRAIDKVDLTSGTKSKWTTLPSGLVVKYCDFSSNNYFYCGGTGSDLIYFPFDLSSAPVKSGFYSNDDIQAIRFYNGYIYVASVLTAGEPAKIWKNKVNQDGSVGSKELVFDLSTTGDSVAISGIAFGADGKMYITTYDASDPMLVIDPGSNSTDIFYKGILPQYCQGIFWGTGNYLYMINGNSAANVTWLAYRVDMGQKSVPYY